MRQYILATVINISLLASLFLIGTTIRNDYGIFFGMSIFLLTIVYCLMGLYIFLRFIRYKNYWPVIVVFVMSFCLITSVYLLSIIGKEMSAPYYFILITNIVTWLLMIFLLLFAKRS